MCLKTFINFSLKEVCGGASETKSATVMLSKLDEQKLKLLDSSDEDEEAEVFGEIRLQDVDKLQESDSEETVFVIASNNEDATEHAT